MASRPTKSLELDLTIVSGKHLKNVNWRQGRLKPYVVAWLEPDRKLSTPVDDSSDTEPVWNERFTLPVNRPLPESLLTLEIYHSESSEPTKPLVGTARFPLKDEQISFDSRFLRTLHIRRPSGRPQGKIKVKIAVKERSVQPSPAIPPPEYPFPPPVSYYYSGSSPHSRDYRSFPNPPSLYINLPPIPHPLSPPPPPPPAVATNSSSSSSSAYQYSSPPYANLPAGFSDAYPGYHSGYCHLPPPYLQQAPATPPPLPRPFYDRASGYGAGPSAPVDCSYGGDYAQQQKGKGSGRMGAVGSGLAIGAVAGALGGLALDEGLKYEEEKITERVESDLDARDGYSDYQDGY